MPYVSGAQRGWAHTSAGTKALGGPQKVAEWDQASKGQHVPYHVSAGHTQGDPIVNKRYLGKTTKYAAGGPVLGRTENWLKTPDQFTDGRLPPKDTGRKDDPEQDYEKPRKGSAPPATGKQLNTVKPQ